MASDLRAVGAGRVLEGSRLQGGTAAEGFDGRLRLPALEDVDAAGVDQVGGDGKVEAASCPACPFDDTHSAREVGLALLCPATMTMGALLFCHLREGLPGISSNILADRLETLEMSGVVRRRTLPAPAASKVYELTGWGMELEPVVATLGRWGVRSPWRGEEDKISVDGLVVSFQTMFDPEAAGELEASYELVIGDQRFGLEVKNGGIRVYRGATGDPDARIQTDVDTLGALVYEGGDLDDALRSGNVEIEGDRSAVERLMGLFPLPEPAPKPTVTRQG